MRSNSKFSPVWFLALGLVACSSGSDDPPVVPVNASLQTLSGEISGPGGLPLAGATVRFEGVETTTSLTGAFILPGIGAVPVGARQVEIDGTTATTPGTYPELEILVDVSSSDTDVILPQQIVLPNLASVDAGNQQVTTSISGVTDQAIDLDGPAGDLGLDGPAGTVILLGSAPASGPVDLNVTPVPNDEVPMPLPGGLQASSFVTIQPGNGRFTTPTGDGLDVRLPNGLGLPIGTEVDIWSFDHDVSDWVNRTDETGNRGTVVDIGDGNTAVDASGVITEGGWHAPVVPVNVEWATTISGRIVDGTGTPVTDVSVFTDLGQFTQTEVDGTFRLFSVAAYDLAETEICTPREVTVTAMAPLTLGATLNVITTVTAGDVVPGGETAMDDIALAIPGTGCVSGQVLGLADASVAGVTISGPTNLFLTPAVNGSFFDCSLDPGNYTASYFFPGATTSTTTEFSLAAGEIATVVIQMAMGTGSETITVNVARRGGGPAPMSTPVDGALVLLAGADLGSSEGLVQMTNEFGQTTFENVDGPFTVTAVAEFSSEGSSPGTVFRQASSVIGLDPTGNEIGLLLNLGGADGPATPPADATLTGTLTGVPSDCTVDLVVTNREFAGSQPTFQNGATGQATYAIPVPSGQALDLFFRLICTTSTGGLGYELDMAPFASGETRTLDLDLSQGLALLDQAVSVVPSGVESPAISTYGGELDQTELMGGFQNNIVVTNGFSNELPAEAALPDLAAAPSNLFDNVIEFENSYGDSGTSRSQEVSTRLTATPPTLSVVLPASSSLISPSLPAQFISGQFQGETLVFTAPGGTNGVNLFQIRNSEISQEKSTTEGSPLLTDWTIWAGPAVTSLTIPPAPSTVLLPNLYDVEFSGARFEGVTSTLSGIFNEQVNLNINALLEDYTVFRTGNVEFPIEITQAP